MIDHGGRTVITGDGQSIVLGALIKAGGAGGVYRLAGSTAQVAKIYHANVDLADNERRIAAMLELRPQLPELQAGDEHVVQLAWPQALIYDEKKHFLGYLMPAVDIEATSELECVLLERQARKLGLPTGLGAKVTLAANLCAVIAELHRQRHYVVDLKPVNLRFYRQSLYMAMLDCDGFSIQGHGERFEAPQYTPDYLAPEFHARGLFGTGEVQQDRFALAVVVFQLLNFGIHPFTGRPQDESVPNDIPSRIAGRWYAHGTRPNTLLLPTPASGHAAMPDELRQLFDRAFESAGGTRPAADEWSDALRGYAQRAAGKLTVCERDATHQHFLSFPCAACARAELIELARAEAWDMARMPRPAAPPLAPTGAPPPRAPAKAPPSNNSLQRRARWQARQGAVIAARTAAAPKPTAPPPPWPAPAPAPTSPVSINSTRNDIEALKAWLWPRALAVILFTTFLVSVGIYLQNDQQSEADGAGAISRRIASDARKRLEARAQAAAQANERALGAAPVPAQVRTLEREFGQLARDTAFPDNAIVFERRLLAMRQAAAARHDAWLQEVQGNTEADTAADPLLAYAAERREQGWAALSKHYRQEAYGDFARALWAEPTDAKAWLGFGVSDFELQQQRGAFAIAMLHQSDADAIRSMRSEAIERLVALGFARDRAQHQLMLAARQAEALRPFLGPGTVPYLGSLDEFTADVPAPQ